MYNYSVFGLICCVLLGVSGCASLTQGTSQTIIFNLEPKSINCNISRVGDGQLGTLSYNSNTLTVSKDKDDILVACKAPGFKPKSVLLTSSTQAAAVVGGLFLDLGITDMITGAAWKYGETVNISLEKELTGYSDK